MLARSSFNVVTSALGGLGFAIAGAMQSLPLTSDWLVLDTCLGHHILIEIPGHPGQRDRRDCQGGCHATCRRDGISVEEEDET